MKSLIIAAHMDDEVLASAGLIQDRVRNKDTVKVIAMFGRKYGGVQRREDQFAEQDCMDEARDVLGYQDYATFGWEEGVPYAGMEMTRQLQLLEEALAHFNPDEVVIPGRADLNQDHRYLNELCRIALRPANLGQVVRILEALAHDTLDGPQQANYGVLLTKRMVDKAKSAMRCYERESRTVPHPRSPENMVARWRLYGAQFGCEYAEPYNLIMERV